MVSPTDIAADMLLPREEGLRLGEDLVFVLGAWRGGTTLLRKVLDTHPGIYSPAETWFLLPLLNMWEGLGEHPRFRTDQAAAALKQHLSQGAFVSCVRAFAARFYAETMPPQARLFVDKTPLYLRIAGALPSVFPRARFLVLARDPRSILWSRHTWKHAKQQQIRERIGGVVSDVQSLAGFLHQYPERATLVSYERLCLEPRDEAAHVCSALGMERDDKMVEYGTAPHHEGYGDERANQHTQPHRESVRRWEGAMPLEIQRELFEACGSAALRVLGYEGVAPGD